MGFTEPDSPPPPAGVPQQPQSPGAGSEPVPYTGPGQAPEPPVYSVPPVGEARGATGMVMDGYAPGNAVAGGPLSVGGAVVAAPYVAGAPQEIAGAGGQDIVSGTVAGAVAAAQGYHASSAADIGAAAPAAPHDFSLPAAHNTDYAP